MGSPLGVHRVREPAGVLPQAAWRLDPRPRIEPEEVRVAVERLNLDAASFRQLTEAHGGDGAAVRAEVLKIIDERGKLHNPVTGSGGMLVGTVEEVGPDSPLGLRPGDRVATLVSLTLTPLAVTDALAGWDGRGEQAPCAGHAILFGRSAAAVLPDDLDPALALAVLDVCGAPALTARVVRRHARAAGKVAAGEVTVAVLGAAGKSGSLSLAAARRAVARAAGPGTADPGTPGRSPGPAAGSGAAAGSGVGETTVRTVGVVPDRVEHDRLVAAGLADTVVVADARDPLAVHAAVTGALGGRGADVTVVCVDVPGAEHGAILATAAGGTVVFFSMATSFTAAALGAEGLAADVTMLIGNGYVPGHARLALDLLRGEPGVRSLIAARLQAH